MKYVSTNEIAKRWGVSRKTVNRYALEGRIKDAYQVGNIWMIPEGTRKEDCTHQVEEFIFPIYLYNDFYNIKQRLHSKEEHELYNAQALYNESKLEESYIAHKALLHHTTNLYIRIGCLYMLCIISRLLGYYKEHMQYQMILESCYVDEFPYKKEMMMLLYEAEASCIGNESLLNNTVDCSYKYSKQVYALFMVEEAYKTVYDALSNKPSNNINLLELACQDLKDKGCYILLIRIHLFLASTYGILKENDKAENHIIEAYHIGEQYNILYNFSLVYSLASDMIDSILEKHGLSIPQAIKDYSKNDQKTHTALLQYLSKSTNAFNFNNNDAKIISLVATNHTNKEIASIMNLSESAISNRLIKLYNQFAVNNKKELMSALIKVINQY